MLLPNQIPQNDMVVGQMGTIKVVYVGLESVLFESGSINNGSILGLISKAESDIDVFLEVRIYFK